jgi:hypothetical protein
MPAPAIPTGYKQPMDPVTGWDKGVWWDPSDFPTLKEMKQWNKWKCLCTATTTAQLVEMVLDSNCKLPAGEEKLYHWQLMCIFKVLLDTVLESSLRVILHQGEANPIP